MTTEFVTSPGRIVWGNPARSVNKKDQKTRQPILRDGKQVEQWVFGVAFPKAEFQQFIMPYLQQEIQSVFPHGVPPQFSWKIKDGDGVDRSGKPYNTREGYAGCFVLTISTEAFAPPIYKNENGRYRQLEANEIKTGDYIVTKLNVKANIPTNASHTPGIYINPVGIELIGYGAEIVSSNADPDEMFGGRTYNLPPGATATPQAPQTSAAAPYMAPAQQSAHGVPAPTATPQYMTPGSNAGHYALMPVSPSNPLPPPAHDFVHNAGHHAQAQGIPMQPGNFQSPAAVQSAPVPYQAPMNNAPGFATPATPSHFNPQMPGIPQR